MFGFELVIGGALFWLLVFGVLILCEICTVNESHWGFAWLAGFFGVLWWAASFNPISWVWHNFGTTLIVAGIYVAIGIAWGFCKWWFHLQNQKDSINKRLASLKSDYTVSTDRAVAPFKGTFTDWLEDKDYISRARDNKSLISVWMFWWPFSVFWTFCDDALRRFYNWVIEKYLYLFDKINNAVFGSLNQ